MKPAEKRKAKKEAEDLRAELKQLEARLARIADAHGSNNGVMSTTIKNRIAEVQRKLTSLNIK